VGASRATQAYQRGIFGAGRHSRRRHLFVDEKRVQQTIQRVGGRMFSVPKNSPARTCSHGSDGPCLRLK